MTRNSTLLTLVGAMVFWLGGTWAATAQIDTNDIAVFDPANFSQEVTECDRLISHPLDPHRVAPGVSQAEADLPAAIEACEAAVAADPTNPRLRYHLSRSYGYSGMGEKAMPHREAAVAAGYPQSLFTVGYLYIIGSTIDRDVCRGGELVRLSAKAGRLAGQVGYVHYVLDGTFDGCDMAMDWDEMTGFLEAAQEQSGTDFYKTLLIAQLAARIDERQNAE